MNNISLTTMIDTIGDILLTILFLAFIGFQGWTYLHMFSFLFIGG